MDGLRALAVLAVLAYHAAVTLRGPTPAWMLCGSHGVDLFFVVSGFCLSYPILLKRRNDVPKAIRYGTFLARRVTRIVPPYLVALTFFALLSFTSFGLPTAVAGLRPSVGGTLHAYLLDALFITGPDPALNGSFWTMGIEMGWYLIFPPIMLLFMKAQWAFAALIALCYALSLATPFAATTLGALPAFASGIFIAELRVRDVRFSRYALLAAVSVGALAVWAPSNLRFMDRANPLWQMFAFCIVLASGSKEVARLLRWEPLCTIGIASFSIYLVHQPIEAYVEHHGFSAWIGGLAGLVLGFAFYALVERPLTKPAFRKLAESFVLGILRHVAHRPMNVPIPGG